MSSVIDLDPLQAGADGSYIGRWRERLLDRVLRVGLLVGTVPALLSIGRAFQNGEWRHASMAVAVLACVSILIKHDAMGLNARAWMTMLILYSLGLWLLVRVGAVTQLYLLACPIMAVLLLGAPTALAMLAACTATLVGVGWMLDLNLPIAGFEGQAGMKWINQGANFGFVGLLLTLSAAYMLRRLENALVQQRAVADSLRSSEESLRQIAAQVPGMVYRWHFDNQGQPTFVYVSPGAQALLGLSPDDLLADGWRVHRMVTPDDRARLAHALSRAQVDGAALTTEFRVSLADGSEKWIHLSSSEVSRDADGMVHNGIMVDITERKASEALVWQQAHFDALTGLPNRRMLRDRLAQAMAQSRRNQQPMALMLIDLDHFKEVNDTLGHDRGDQLLVEAARRIRECLAHEDIVARMGGDEFTVVLPTLNNEVQADLAAQRIIASLGAAFMLGPERAYVSASIGITLYPDDADSIESLLKHADQALYVAKDAGRNRFRYFTRALQDQAQLRMRLANDLRSALRLQQFKVEYQPIVDLRNGRIHKAEALIRWHHPERGLISPALFIPIAESTGLIGDIGDWVFRTAALQVQQWRKQIDPSFQISVNRSPVQFRSDAEARPAWEAHLAQLGLAGDSIVVEITEGLLLDTGPGVAEQLLALRAAGIPVSLDDFGTGYSSMAYLQKYDIDFLKIDRSFVSGMDQGLTSRTLCKAMILMAHELGMQVIAEGVETEEQRDWLAQAGCDYAQGYLFARPMPATKLGQLLGVPASVDTDAGGAPRLSAPADASLPGSRLASMTYDPDMVSASAATQPARSTN